jgi:hypothetical protein
LDQKIALRGPKIEQKGGFRHMVYCTIS